MTLLSRAPIDLLLAPVAVHLDMNLARLRDMSPHPFQPGRSDQRCANTWGGLNG